MTQISTTQQGGKQADDKNTIRPFHVNFPDADLTWNCVQANATKIGLSGETVRGLCIDKACSSRPIQR